MYVILQLQHSVGDVSNSTSSTVQSLTELVVFYFLKSVIKIWAGASICFRNDRRATDFMP